MGMLTKVMTSVVVSALAMGVASPVSGAQASVRAVEQQRGITLWGWTDTAYGEPSALQALDRIAATGAGWVTFVPMWFQPTALSSSLDPSPRLTTSDAALITAVRAAHQRGLKVTVKPQVDVTDGAWRGAIRPVDSAAWFDRYQGFVNHYGRLGERLGVEQLVVGTELAGVSSETARWSQLIAGTRSVFSGSLTYAALPFEFQRIGFWGQLDLIGVNAYWELSDRGTTDVAELQRAWRPIIAELAAFAEVHGKPVLLTEAGYASQAGTAAKPSSWTLSDQYAPSEQAAAYGGLLRSFQQQPWFAGVHWWAWRATNDPARLDFTPQDKPAEAVLRSFWVRPARHRGVMTPAERAGFRDRR